MAEFRGAARTVRAEQVAATTAGRSIRISRPATPATPASPAAAASSIVRGPITGMSEAIVDLVATGRTLRDNGLVVADVRWCDEDPDDELRPQHALLSTLLQHIIEQAGEDYAPATPALLDQASWVGWQLAQLLPLEESQRLQLLQLDDVHARLDLLLGWIP